MASRPTNQGRRTPELRVKRAYEPHANADGVRLLVDRMWPRGVTKEALHIDEWLKDVAPSTELRKWFAHDPSRWAEFKRRYFAELDERPEVVTELRRRCRGHVVSLVYGAKDDEHNNAVALKEYLEHRGAGARRAPSRN